ncbi:hypothetical protein EDD68_1371 [Melghiribacillus thermohalophilus]|uniref:Uncharacterized protein n=1 Tax=Melghiribacillus thermohalophilus TaxID=1324956 RepID=A0A4R3MLX6_9BACI|nr:hypothetical protein [Melghiribacillus thermohalophilus]TCT15283.1 hypothetical protein EDD68_1371 [Melghiribacillus thermohalophilus]
MKKLREFNRFDCEAFFKDKDVRVMSHEDWLEYDADGKNPKVVGTKYKTVIATDRTEYKGADVAPDLNAGEQVIVKVPKPPKEYKKFSKITFVNPTASVYGTFMSELSVKANDVDIVQPK